MMDSVYSFFYDIFGLFHDGVQILAVFINSWLALMVYSLNKKNVEDANRIDIYCNFSFSSIPDPMNPGKMCRKTIFEIGNAGGGVVNNIKYRLERKKNDKPEDIFGIVSRFSLPVSMAGHAKYSIEMRGEFFESEVGSGGYQKMLNTISDYYLVISGDTFRMNNYVKKLNLAAPKFLLCHQGQCDV